MVQLVRHIRVQYNALLDILGEDATFDPKRRKKVPFRENMHP